MLTDEFVKELAEIGREAFDGLLERAPNLRPSRLYWQSAARAIASKATEGVEERTAELEALLVLCADGYSVGHTAQQALAAQGEKEPENHVK